MPAGRHGDRDVAFRAGSDLSLLTRRLNRAHDDFVEHGRSSGALRTLVLDSWRRCLRDGVDPELSAVRLELSEDELARARAEHPLFAAMPTIRRLLVETAAEAGMVVAVSDAAGRLLWVEGSAGLRSRAEQMAFVPGANWSESSAGTNAPGTALALDRPVQILGAEHLSRPVTPWSCSASPVHDPVTGALLGVLDLTGGPEVAGPQGLALVRATVAAVESEFRAERLRQDLRAIRRPERSGHRRSAATGAPGTQMSVLGRRGALLHAEGVGSASTVELSLRHSEILTLLVLARDGLSAEELAVRLSEQELSSVTVRAELSRMRALLPLLAMASRPYRLATGVRTDFADVRADLRAGRLRSAVAGYPGPILPRSVAPGVVEARNALHQELRRALLEGRDPDALLGFADTEHGRDDLEVWRAALAALPAGSPRHPQVATHCEALAISLG